LRHVVMGSSMIPLYLPDGTPVVTVDGEGPLFEPAVTGTGFVIAGGRVVTNRHVVNALETGPFASFMASPQIKPVRTRLTGYAPGKTEPFQLEVATISDDYDLAALSAPHTDLAELALQFGSDTPELGESVVVLGYPMGLNAVLARAGTQYRESALSDDISDTWSMAAKLAADGEISPLASSGIIAQVTGSAVVYDAETASGGSGGPILTLDNKVIAVNTAILPGFGGSNLGIPIAAVVELLALN